MRKTSNDKESFPSSFSLPFPFFFIFFPFSSPFFLMKMNKTKELCDIYKSKSTCSSINNSNKEDWRSC